MSADEAQDAKAVRQQITDWLIGEGWTVGGTPKPVADTVWAVQAIDNSGKSFVLGQPSTRPDLLVVQTGIKLDTRHAKKLGALSREEQEEFCWELRFQLLERVGFNGVGVPLEAVNFIEKLFVEDLTRTHFFETLRGLQNAMLAVIWMVWRKLGQPLPDEDEPEREIN